jgi:hypothetical protein
MTYGVVLATVKVASTELDDSLADQLLGFAHDLVRQLGFVEVVLYFHVGLSTGARRLGLVGGRCLGIVPHGLQETGIVARGLLFLHPLFE